MTKERRILYREPKVIPGMKDEKVDEEQKECHNCGSIGIHIENNEYVCHNCDLTWEKR